MGKYYYNIIYHSNYCLGSISYSFTPIKPSSSLSPITGACLFAILSAVSKRMGSIGLVHIQDICMAHLSLIEEPKAEGQCICCVDNIDMHDLMLNHFYQNFHNFILGL
ncbi:unnamed protein product [Brassica oleracea var. botrytis]|uniref:Uncharacterized protein n=1 Tax=Brassica oleracea TaxID=3712 RepID=A0A3P6FSH1_BRAOL|nr:unnamed protein product [Brassica oleracea]